MMTLVKDTPKNEGDLVKELREITNGLKIRERLRAWTVALRVSPRKNIKGFKWLLLVLNVQVNKIKVQGYASRREAVEALAEIEQSKQPALDAVLVWVQSVNDLRAAYPNYYADTREFLSALDSALMRPGRI